MDFEHYDFFSAVKWNTEKCTGIYYHLSVLKNVKQYLFVLVVHEIMCQTPQY